MKMSKRLLAIAGLIPPGAAVADIGTDHAQLPRFLIESGICSKVVATEKNPGPLEAARSCVAELNLAGQIDLRPGDGLAPLRPGEVDTVVMAGMGATTIQSICESAPEVLAGVERLIVQPMSYAGHLRNWLAENNWRLVYEQLVRENERLYLVIKAKRGCEEVDDPFFLAVGPLLVKRRDPLLPLYLDRLENELLGIRAGLFKSSSEPAREKVRSIEIFLKKMEELRSCLYKEEK